MSEDRHRKETGLKAERQDDRNRRNQTARDTGAIDREHIERRAYERYQARGGEDGRDLEDWFEAEREAQERE